MSKDMTHIETDGVLAWEVKQHTKNEPDFIEALKQEIFNRSPEGRICSLKSFLASIESIDERFTVRRDELSEQITKAEKAIASEDITECHMDKTYLLELAERKMDEIIALPLALSGVGSANGGKLGRENRDKNIEPTKEAWRNAAKTILATRKRPPTARNLARLVASKLHPQANEGEINKLADSRRKWIADML